MDGQPDGHYFTEEPTAGSSPATVVLDLPDGSMRLRTDRGVFSGGRVDPGTKLLLLDGAPPPPGPRVLLDLGCGYGPIALTLARRAPDATVWAVDVNRRARDLCVANAAANGLDNVHVAAPDDIGPDVRFDGLWSNPPIRIGKAALHALLETWLGRLTPSGAGHLVVARNLGSDSLHSWLSGRGWMVHRRGSRAGYRLLDIERGPRT